MINDILNYIWEGLKHDANYLFLGVVYGIPIIFLCVFPVLLVMWLVYKKDFDGSGFGFFGYYLVKLLNKITKR